MDVDNLREYCLSIKGAAEEMPFKEPYLIFKVLGKWFALVPMQDEELNVSLKCDPNQALEWNSQFFLHKKLSTFFVSAPELIDSHILEC